MPNRSRGHHAFSHDALSGLAYDWERVGDPEVAARWPFKVYLPRSTDDVVRAVREARAAGERLIVRGSGHSSNGLVTADGGAVLLTELLNRVVELDERGLTCTIQPGARLAEVDRQLGRRGLGLTVVGDHEELTAGGFASVGGISPASHRFGLFVDTVSELEYVDWDGQLHRCGRGDAAFRRVLAGLGRHGVITELTVDVQRIHKHETLLRNHRYVTGRLPEFLSRAAALVRSPEPALYA
ncbi:MAG: FAD-binding oxidoreductase, partial [Thermocrispum sp.]